MDAFARPVIMFEDPITNSKTANPNLTLENIGVTYAAQCKLHGAKGPAIAGQFTLLRCLSHDPSLHSYFLRVMSFALEALGEKPRGADLFKLISQLVELFRALSVPPQKSVQGYWAELFLLSLSRKPSILIQAWRAFPEDKHDFNAGFQRIEVKSASGRIRRHHFSLEQLKAPSKVKVLVASMFVERAGGGLSLHDLLEKVRSRLLTLPGQILRLEQMTAQTLGSSWQQALDERFDEQLATDSLLFLWAEVVPSICCELPPDVSNVHFVSDLSHCNGLRLKDVKKLGGLFSAF